MHAATMVLIDGDLQSLMACAMDRVQPALTDGPTFSPVLGLPFPALLDSDRLRHRAIRSPFKLR